MKNNEHRPTLVRIASIASVLALTFLAANASAAAKDRMVGSYFVEFDASALFMAPPGAVLLPGVVTINADRTMQGVDGTDGGFASMLTSTPSQGTWNSRSKQFSGEVVYLSFAPNSGGALALITKLTVVAKFAPGFRTATGLACQQNIILAGPYNPATDNPNDLPDITCDTSYIDPATGTPALPASLEKF